MAKGLMDAMKKARVDHYGEGAPEVEAKAYGTLKEQ
jgi:hypothetical protein